MEAVLGTLTIRKNWRLISTSPLSGEENMRQDRDTLLAVGRGEVPPTVRFFRFSQPTVTFGRLQQLHSIQPKVPAGWAVAQRPTGGGLVFHEKDLCVSLAWPKGQPPIPTVTKEIYPWIHQLLKLGLGNYLKMAACADVCAPKSPFETRECFTEPVGYDLLSGGQKVVGGALWSTRTAILYQGSIQIPDAWTAEPTLQQMIGHRLEADHD